MPLGSSKVSRTDRPRSWGMPTIVDSSDGDVARAVATRAPGVAETAEAELYRRFAPRVRLYGLRHLRDEDEARDLSQQVMLLAIEKLRGGAIRDADQIASFVLGVSRTMVKDWQRLDWRREKLRASFLSASMIHRSYPSPDGKRMLMVEMNERGDIDRCRLAPMDGSSTGQQVGPPSGSCTFAA